MNDEALRALERQVAMGSPAEAARVMAERVAQRQGWLLLWGSSSPTGWKRPSATSVEAYVHVDIKDWPRPYAMWVDFSMDPGPFLAMALRSERGFMLASLADGRLVKVSDPASFSVVEVIEEDEPRGHVFARKDSVTCSSCKLRDGGLTAECPGQDSREWAQDVNEGRAEFVAGRWVDLARARQVEFLWRGRSDHWTPQASAIVVLTDHDPGFVLVQPWASNSTLGLWRMLAQDRESYMAGVRAEVQAGRTAAPVRWSKEHRERRYARG